MSRNWLASNYHKNVQVKKMPNRVFVGGLPFDTTSSELVEFFKNFGAVLDGKVIYDQENVSRGYGFITFYRVEDVEKVLKLGVIFFKEKRLKIAEAFRRLKKRYPETSDFIMPTTMQPAASQLPSHSQPRITSTQYLFSPVAASGGAVYPAMTSQIRFPGPRRNPSTVQGATYYYHH